MNLTQIPNQVVRTGFDLARLPVALVGAKVATNGEIHDWPPYMVFQSVEAEVKNAAGRLLRDESLAKEAAEIRGRVEKLRQAATLEKIASQRKAESDVELHKTLTTNEKRVADVERRTERIKDSAATDASEAKRKVNKQAAEAKAEVADLREREQQEMDVEATVAELAAVGAQVRAEQLEAAAVAEQNAARRATNALKSTASKKG